MNRIIQKIREIGNDPERRKELILYIAFGLATTAVNWIVYEIMRSAVGMGNLSADSADFRILGNVCNVTAWIISVLFAFVTNKRFVFRSQSKDWKSTGKELLMFVSARLLSLALFDIGLYSALLFVMNDRLGKLITNVFVVVFNYFASKFVIFRKHGP